MKPVILTFTDQDGKPTKTYSTCSIKSGLFTKLIPIAERAKEFQESDSYGASEIGAFLVEVEALIVDAFGRQFTIDELQAGVEITELFRVIAELFSAINVKNLAGGTAKK